jgi:hypothetical protein
MHSSWLELCVLLMHRHPFTVQGSCCLCVQAYDSLLAAVLLRIRCTCRNVCTVQHACMHVCCQTPVELCVAVFD